jgi:hypothetical protein
MHNMKVVSVSSEYTWRISIKCGINGVYSVLLNECNFDLYQYISKPNLHKTQKEVHIFSQKRRIPQNN